MLAPHIMQELEKITEREQMFLDGVTDLDHTIYMQEHTNRMDSRKLLKEGHLISLSRHARFWPCPEHVHDYVEVMYMCRGETMHTINGEKVHLAEGNLLFLSQNARQSVDAAGENDIAVNFIILPQFFDEVLPMMEVADSPLRCFLLDCLRPNPSASSYLLFEIQNLLPVQNLVENLIWSLLFGSRQEQRTNQLTMGVLLRQLLEHTDRLIPSDTAEVAVQVLRYIEENYQSGSLQELSSRLHYSTGWLSREIKRKTGKTFTELLLNKRISLACSLLRCTDLNIDEIAYRVGYNNVSHFYKIFQRETGVSPRAWRLER